MLLALLSPAKRLDFDADDLVGRGALAPSKPLFNKDTAILAARAKRYSVADLRRLMELSPALAKLNHERFQVFSKDVSKKAAIYAFAGDVYQGFEAKSLSKADMVFAQDHIAILSGLYGLLRPLDLIAPYRLEMHSRVDTERGDDLYAFWREALTAHINRLTAKMKQPTIVNLASTEYWSAVDEAKLAAPVIQPVFKEIRAGKAQVISFLAKKARGMMARHIVQSRAAAPDDLKAFDTGGYRYDAAASTPAVWVFSRKLKPK